MCGIIYVKREDGIPANRMVEKRYQAQKTRGKEGFGYVSLENGVIKDYFRSSEEIDILEALETDPSTEILFHHRFPTSTENYAEAAHPIKIVHESLEYDYYMVHNGVISNDKELKEEFSAIGYKYSTELTYSVFSWAKKLLSVYKWNDSESLGIDLALAIESGQTKIKSKGSIAFIMIQTEKGSANAKSMFFGRNDSNPLKIDFISKCYLALTSAGNGKDVDPHTLFKLDYSTGEISESLLEIGYKYTNKYSYSPKEKLLDLPKGKKDSWELNFEDEYYELLMEQHDLKKKLQDEKLSTEEWIRLEERLEEVVVFIEEHEDEYVRRAGRE